MTLTIKPKDFVLVEEIKRTLQALSYTTIDDTDNRLLTIKFRPLFTGGQRSAQGIVPNTLPDVVISGDEYDALGQYDDEAIKKIVCAELGVEVTK